MTHLLTYIIICIIHFFALIMGKRGQGLKFNIQKKLDTNNYFTKDVLNKKLKFYAPNDVIKWRFDTIFTKEPETIQWINNFEDNNDFIFWDIGANVGVFSLYAALKYENIKTYAFEPSTSNLRVLSRNISINGLENKILINPLPLFDKKPSFQMMSEGNFVEGGALNSFSVNYGYDGKEFDVKNKYFLLGTSLNFLIEENILQTPQYIKLDVDGIEDLILKGASDFLKSEKIKSILVEINEDYADQKDKLINFLENKNFKLMYKKHSKEFDTSKKYSGIYNYVFNKNEHKN